MNSIQSYIEHDQWKKPVAMLLFYMGCILWLGSIIFFGFGVAGVLFRGVLSKDLAGTINGIILGRLNALEYAAALFIISSLLLFNLMLKSLWSKIPLALVGVMLVLTLLYSTMIRSSMEDIRMRVHSFENPQPQDVELIAEFRGYHKMYSRLVGINMGLGFTLFVWQTLLFAYSDRFARKTMSSIPPLPATTNP